MTVSLDTLLGASARNMGAVHPRTREYAMEFIKRAYAAGLKVLITSGLRTMEEQARLYGQGRASYVYNGKQYARAGNVVTNAKPGQSVHNYGYAVDFALMLDSGAVVWDLKKDDNDNGRSDWFEAAAIAKSMGFAWGGDWKSFKDYPHIDLGGLTWSQLATGRRPSIAPLVAKTWLDVHDTGDAVEDVQRDLNRVMGSKLTVDGYYGEGTKAAVESFQKKYGLTVDGQFGKASAMKLAQLIAELDKPVPAPVPGKPAVIIPAAPKPKPIIVPVKEGEQIMDLAKWQQADMAKAYTKAHEKGIFSDDSHAEKVQRGELTVEDGIYLVTVLAGASINGGKRL